MSKKTILFSLGGIAAALIFGTLFSDLTSQKAPTTTPTNPPASTVNNAGVTTPVVTTTQAGDELDTTRVSEAFGHFIGRNLKNPGMHFDLESIIKGMRDGASGKPAPMSDQEYELMMVKMQEKAFNQVSTQNLKAATDYLEKNKSAEGVKEIEPGKLQYLVLKEGSGAVVEAHNSPLINYTGKFIDGTVFSSSEELGNAITIPLDQTIQGFSKGLVGMKEGEKRRLFVHPDLGYGVSGQLPPNSLLIFDVEVVKANNTDLNQTSADEEDLSISEETEKDSEESDD